MGMPIVEVMLAVSRSRALGRAIGRDLEDQRGVVVYENGLVVLKLVRI